MAEMYFADDLSAASDALSALAYTSALIVAASANGLQTNARQPKLVADSQSEGIVNFLFAPLQGGDPFDDVVRTPSNRAWPTTWWKSTTPDEAWEVQRCGRLLGCPISDPTDWTVCQAANAFLRSRLCEPIRRLRGEVEEGRSMATARFLLSTYVLPHLEMISFTWGATLPSADFARVDNDLRALLEVGVPLQHLLGAGATYETYDTGPLLAAYRRTVPRRDPPQGPLREGNAFVPNWPSRGVGEGWVFPWHRCSLCVSRRTCVPHGVGFEPPWPPLRRSLWPPNAPGSAMAASTAYDDWRVFGRKLVNKMIATYDAPTRLYRQVRRENMELHGGVKGAQVVPWDPDRRLDARQFRTFLLLAFGSEMRQRRPRRALRGPWRGYAGEDLFDLVTRRVAGPGFTMRRQPPTVMAPSRPPSTRIPPAAAGAGASARNAPPRTRPDRDRADFQIPGPCTIDVSMQDGLARTCRNTPRPSPQTKLMTSVEDRKRLKYDDWFGGGAFFALVFSLLGGVTEVGRLVRRGCRHLHKETVTIAKR